jgi:hypothetical protein
MTMRSFVSLAISAALIVVPIDASAQLTAPNEPELWRTVAAKLEPASLVSLRLKNGERLKGTVLASDAKALTIKPHTRIPVPAREISFDEIASLQREKPSISPAKKVLLGVGIGAVAYMLAVVAVVSSLD